MPPEGLCASLARGFLLAQAGYRYTRELSCSPALDDTDMLALIYGARDDDIASACAPMTGWAWVLANGISNSASNGRIHFDEDALNLCHADAATKHAAAGGWWQLFAVATATSTDLPADHPCNHVVTPLQEPGQPCRRDLECTPGTTGAVCAKQVGEDCAGVCQRLGVDGAECETRGNPDCAAGFTCLHGSDGHGVCVAHAPVGQGCGTVDGGSLPCASPNLCIDDNCVAPHTKNEGDPCDDDDECEEGSACKGSPRACRHAAAANEECSTGGGIERACPACHSCDDDGTGVRRCLPWGTPGADCVDGDCVPNAMCIEGTCFVLAQQGETCTIRDESDMTGSCMNADHACAGDPPTCQPRGQENAPCTSSPRVSSQGSCAPDFTCVRAAETDTQGTCAPPARNQGDRCGQKPGLTAECLGSALALRCSTSQDDEEGVCVVETGGTEGALCASSYGCADGFWCAPSASMMGARGTCTRAPAIGQSCADSDDRCSEGRCEGGMCSGFLDEGSACSQSFQCGPMRFCGTARTCETRGGRGADCAQSDACLEGFECVRGLCTANECNESSCLGCAGPTSLPMLFFLGIVIRRRQKAPTPA